MSQQPSAHPKPSGNAIGLPLVGISLLAALLSVYLPNVGHGFIKDDVRWVLETRARSAADVAALFQHHDGFYRPIVSASFAANEWIAASNPRLYGIANLVLMLACAAAVLWLALGIGMEKGATLERSHLRRSGLLARDPRHGDAAMG